MPWRCARAKWWMALAERKAGCNFLPISPKVDALRRSYLGKNKNSSPVLSDTSGAICMEHLFLTLKKVIMSSMGSFGGQTKWRGAWGEERWVNSFSNGVLICGGNLQRAAPGCASRDDETEVTAWQLLLVVSLIRQPQQQTWRRMMDSVAPAQLRHEGCRERVREGLIVSVWKKERGWGVGGVVLYSHVNQVGSWP